jgi:hypothetical protein
VIGAG